MLSLAGGRAGLRHADGRFSRREKENEKIQRFRQERRGPEEKAGASPMTGRREAAVWALDGQGGEDTIHPTGGKTSAGAGQPA